MDNVTHSLVGYALGQVFPLKEPKHRTAAIWVAVIGSNIPDLDFLTAPFGVSGNLGYLLTHRGYTHTLLLSLPLGIISAWAGIKLARSKVTSKGTSLSLCGLGILSVVFHIAADFCNNYGVHPFSPFYNRWFYGDILFIVEPLLWLSLLPVIYFTSQAKAIRTAAVVLEVLILALLWSLYFSPFYVAFCLTIWGASWVFIQKRFQSPGLGLASIAFVIAIFSLTSSLVRKEFEATVASMKPNTEIQEVMVNPLPGNPVCWAGIVLSTEGSRRGVGLEKTGGVETPVYAARSATFSIFPQWVAPSDCLLRKKLQPLIPLESTSGNNARIHWIGEFRKPLSEFKALVDKSCRFKAFLRFARIPIWDTRESLWVAGDLRYDVERGHGFSKIDLKTDKGECPSELPPWEPPVYRSELIKTALDGDSV